MMQDSIPLDPIDRRLVVATQAGLPLVARPYAALALALGLSEDEVLSRLRSMLQQGIIRRIGAVPNHFRLGYRANGMSVWDVDDAEVDRLGAQVGALRFVTHCYRRPRRPPLWPYNLFAMVHGHDRTQVQAKLAQIADLLGTACRASDVLYSRRILKKTGLRLKDRSVSGSR
jgi:DNA-binding Lrp family transcriptional regulator